MLRTRRLLLLLALLLLPVALLALGYGFAYASRDTPAMAIAEVLATTRAAGAYHLTADVQQTLIPRAAPANIGKRDQQATLRVEGDFVPSTANGRDTTNARLQ